MICSFLSYKNSRKENAMKKLLFIYNPNAGKGLIKPKLSDVLDIFVKAGYEVTVYTGMDITKCVTLRKNMT